MQPLANMESSLMEIVNNRVANFPETIYNCNDCQDSGWLLNSETERFRRCACVYGHEYKSAIEKLQGYVKKDLNIQSIMPRSNQEPALNHPGSLWLVGENGTGKSICAALVVRTELERHRDKSQEDAGQSRSPLSWAWLDFREWLRLIEDEYRNGVHANYNYDVLVLDDIDKIENFSGTRYEFFFKMMVDVIRRGTKVIFTSNILLKDFVELFEKEKDQQNGEGVGPLMRRFIEDLNTLEPILR